MSTELRGIVGSRAKEEFSTPPRNLLRSTLAFQFVSEMTSRMFIICPHDFYFPSEYPISRAGVTQKIFEPVGPQIGVYEKAIKLGLHFPLHPF